MSTINSNYAFKIDTGKSKTKEQKIKRNILKVEKLVPEKRDEFSVFTQNGFVGQMIARVVGAQRMPRHVAMRMRRYRRRRRPR